MLEQYRSSNPEVILGKGALKICSKFTGKHPCRSVISKKLLRKGKVNISELNLSKTKEIRKFKFYFQGREIEIVKQYIYLGFSFIPLENIPSNLKFNKTK